MRITNLTASEVVVDTTRRTITGTLYRYGEAGRTSAGLLTVASTFPPPPVGLPMTYEHDRRVVRGHIAFVDDTLERVRIAVRVVDGPEGDAALVEAADRTRAGFSYDVDDAELVDGHIVGGRWVAVGQVTNPAYNSARVDHVAASLHPPEGHPMNLTPEQRARLAELLELDALTPEEAAEVDELIAAAAAPVAPAPAEAADPQPATASTPPAPVRPVSASLPVGVPARTRPRPTAPSGGRGALDRFYREVGDAMRGGDSATILRVAAAFTDVTQTEHAHTESPAWSGELWSGLQYEPVFTPLLNSGDLTSWSGAGWRWVTKPQFDDYAGDKTGVPSNELVTEPGDYEAARMAVGHDIDRKFYDFPGGGAFLASYAEAAREDWAVKLDAKVEAYIIDQAVASGVTPGAGSIVTRLARLVRRVQRARLGRSPFVVLNDNDYDRLFDVTESTMPSFFELTGVKPENIVSSANVPADLAIAGAKQAATVRTLPGSPIRVDAQHLANGGVDSAFFGYWAIEEHHTSGILSMDLGYVA